MGFTRPAATARPAWRKAWDVAHSSLGTVALLLGAVNVAIGVVIFHTFYGGKLAWLLMLTLEDHAHSIVRTEHYQHCLSMPLLSGALNMICNIGTSKTVLLGRWGVSSIV